MDDNVQGEIPIIGSGVNIQARGSKLCDSVKAKDKDMELQQINILKRSETSLPLELAMNSLFQYYKISSPKRDSRWDTNNKI